jgi:hypothetical protein
MNKFDRIVLEKLAKEKGYKSFPDFCEDEDGFMDSDLLERAVELARLEILEKIKSIKNEFNLKKELSCFLEKEGEK